MPEGQVLEFTNVTKRFNEVTAVSDFSARVEPGAVTAFLGPNGAGKTTTLRILLGQVRASSGTATIGGVAYPELRQPLRTIGSVLEETVYRPRRTASRQLTIAAKANGIRLSRVDEVLSLVGLDDEADSRIGGFSLGMRQRLSVAHALLGDPGALVFDEPANGLDPEGIRWMRLLMRRLADEGRTVLVSSHVLSEIEQVADHVLVLSKGRLVLSSGIETLADPAAGSVVVDAVDRDGLTTALSAAGFDVEVLRGGLTVRGGDATTVGAVAADAGIALSTLVQRGPTLEDVFIDLMRGGRFGTTSDATTALDTAGTRAEGPGTTPDADETAGADSGIAGAGIAASALAAGGAAALADDLTPETRPESSHADAEDDGQTHDAQASAGADTAADVAQDPSADVTVAQVSATTGPVAVVAVEEDVRPVTMEDAPSIDEGSSPSEADTSPARSFDEILFGGAAAAQDDEPTDRPTRRSLAQLFATTQDAEHTDDSSVDPSPEGDADSAATERAADEFSDDQATTDASGEAAATDGSHAGGAAEADGAADDAPQNEDAADESSSGSGSDDSALDADADADSPADAAAEDGESSDAGDRTDDETDEDHAGIEFFAELDGTEGDNALDEAPADDQGSDHETDADADEAQPDASAADAPAEAHADEAAADETRADETDDVEDDPRAAAVSSLLSAAARAYYEDEPRDYPLSTSASAPEPSVAAEPRTEGAHWSVATTGVIDTVPLAAHTATDAQDETHSEPENDQPGDLPAHESGSGDDLDSDGPEQGEEQADAAADPHEHGEGESHEHVEGESHDHGEGDDHRHDEGHEHRD
ncbi:ATP-binding cassette domain-containing protein [Microbacterium paraoxydans]|uniref:ATP-binding cassette domain-containing protein n=1 Tax=Microbacterium paraoxydans TaxID=199592 RepID=A0ABS5ILL5_9MICO|nr:ATP-binding cassette domain-containing protein [Microbacterium paraoxydans]MBS0023838.1 ATP-binding cassette domain-containing protein [Microbacterium paraoxydans]